MVETYWEAAQGDVGVEAGEAGRQLGPVEGEGAEEGEAGRAAVDSSLVGTLAAPAEESAFDRWT